MNKNTENMRKWLANSENRANWNQYQNEYRKRRTAEKKVELAKLKARIAELESQNN